MRAAEPQVLEPIARLNIRCSEEAIGHITGDLAGRRGMVSGTDSHSRGGMSITANAPMAELADYQTRLHALTAGQGRYTLALSHYEAVPHAMQQSLMAAYQQVPEEE
ncbi:hypothetical protein L0B52_05850 [Suttonella sp. R2A3]|nr:hypothetical protein [Suttonella sp. R2A3]UJF25450.1 hypothetical protein L0B52_05850 [Suttonella sp. R2A3]